MSNFIFALAGRPGKGKTTLGRLLYQELNDPDNVQFQHLADAIRKKAEEEAHLFFLPDQNKSLAEMLKECNNDWEYIKRNTIFGRHILILIGNLCRNANPHFWINKLDTSKKVSILADLRFDTELEYFFNITRQLAQHRTACGLFIVTKEGWLDYEGEDDSEKLNLKKIKEYHKPHYNSHMVVLPAETDLKEDAVFLKRLLEVHKIE